ncbi:MAG: carbonic anhydrase [Streptosporangiaceae bacterium]
MSVTDRLLANNERYAASFPGPPPERTPSVAIVACMDARLNVYSVLGLTEGEAHVIRNAGGAVTDDTIRSLSISQRLLGTREIVLIHHTQCGMLTFTDDDFRSELETETGIRPPWAAEAFADLDADVRQSLARIKISPFIPHRDQLRGFVYDLGSGRLREVAQAPARAGSRF